MMVFLLTDELSIPSDTDLRVVRIPRALSSKSELFKHYSESLNFPDYFGMNWDALSDCLRDLSWIRETGILIVHSDVPLENQPVECEIYLDTMADAARFWKDCPDHHFRVAFPRRVTELTKYR